MESLAERRPPLATKGPMPRLCQSVEGVEFWVRVAGARRLRCVITGLALHLHFGATEESCESWIDAFGRHRHDIEGRAVAAAGRRDNAHVILLTDSSGRLKAIAGRCVA